jgi:hypothetical protein
VISQICSSRMTLKRVTANQPEKMVTDSAAWTNPMRRDLEIRVGSDRGLSPLSPMPRRSPSVRPHEAASRLPGSRPAQAACDNRRRYRRARSARLRRNDVGRWDGQFPSVVTVDARERLVVRPESRAQIFGQRVDEPEASRDMVADIAQHREGESVRLRRAE